MVWYVWPNFPKQTLSCKIILIKYLFAISPFCTESQWHLIYMILSFLDTTFHWVSIQNGGRQVIKCKHLIKLFCGSVPFDNETIFIWSILHVHVYCMSCYIFHTVLWTAQGQVLIQNSSKERMGTTSGIFWFMLQSRYYSRVGRHYHLIVESWYFLPWYIILL